MITIKQQQERLSLSHLSLLFSLSFLCVSCVYSHPRHNSDSYIRFLQRPFIKVIWRLITKVGKRRGSLTGKIQRGCPTSRNSGGDDGGRKWFTRFTQLFSHFMMRVEYELLLRDCEFWIISYSSNAFRVDLLHSITTREKEKLQDRHEILYTSQ